MYLKIRSNRISLCFLVVWSSSTDVRNKIRKEVDYVEVYQEDDCIHPFRHRASTPVTGPPVDVPSAINVRQYTYYAFTLTDMSVRIHI